MVRGMTFFRPFDEKTKAKIVELYAPPHNLSKDTLAERYGRSRHAITRVLKDAKIAQRSGQEQRRATLNRCVP